MPQSALSYLTKHAPNANKQLQTIVAKVAALQKTNQDVERFLDNELRGHCKVANFEQGSLVLVVNSAAWATRLRYLLPQLRTKLRNDAEMYNLRTIKVIVSQDPLTETPDNNSSKAKHGLRSKQAVPLSATVAAHIRSSAAEISHEPLRQALQRLAKNTF